MWQWVVTFLPQAQASPARRRAAFPSLHFKGEEREGPTILSRVSPGALGADASYNLSAWRSCRRKEGPREVKGF